jgi:hypothetical protein
MLRRTDVKKNVLLPFSWYCTRLERVVNEKNVMCRVNARKACNRQVT